MGTIVFHKLIKWKEKQKENWISPLINEWEKV